MHLRSPEAVTRRIDAGLLESEAGSIRSEIGSSQWAWNGWTGRLEPAEWRRRAWHFAPGILPLISWLIEHEDPLSPVFKLIALGVAFTIAAALLIRRRTIERDSQERWSAAVAGYAIPGLALMLLFPAHCELAVTVLAILAFGDGSATLCGLLFRSPSLPWNPSKTWAGTIAFVAIGAPLATLSYLGESQPKAPILVAAVCATSAALVAALAESLPVRVNDNIRVGTAAAVTVVCVHGLLIGLA